MKERIERAIRWLTSALEEKSGKASSGRIMGAGCILATLIWVSFLVFTRKALPDLGGASMFVTAAWSGYGMNKVTEIIKSGGDEKKSLDTTLPKC